MVRDGTKGQPATRAALSRDAGAAWQFDEQMLATRVTGVDGAGM
jgi:hypothetical protein